MSLIKREQVSLYDEAKASFVSLIKQTSLVFLGILIMFLMTGGNPPGSVVVMSFVLGIGFVAWSENKRLSNAKARQKAKVKSKQEQVNKSNIFVNANYGSIVAADEVVHRFAHGVNQISEARWNNISNKEEELTQEKVLELLAEVQEKIRMSTLSEKVQNKVLKYLDIIIDDVRFEESNKQIEEDGLLLPKPGSTSAYVE